MSERAPYSRVYWSIRQDPKFRGIYSDDHHLAAWLRLLIAADATWPAPADVPANARKGSVTALSECGLVDLMGDGLFTVHGLEAERGRRRDAATTRGPDGTRTVPSRGPDGTLSPPRVRMSSRDSRATPSYTEPSRDELLRAPDEHDDDDAVFTRMAQAGAFIRPESAMGQRVIGLVARRGPGPVLVELERIVTSAGGPLSDRQIVFGIEAAIETVPAPPSHAEQRADDLEEQRVKHTERVQSEAQSRRVEAYRWTGKWDAETFGPEPAWRPEWGQKPVTA